MLGIITVYVKYNMWVYVTQDTSLNLYVSTVCILHWLTTLPLDRCHFNLAPVEFRDALALRYLWTPPGLPSRCDGCGESFSLQHGLDCPKGDLVIRRHNEIRDCLGDMAALVWSQVIKEPVVRDPASNDPGLRLGALLDIRVIDTDAPSYSRHSPTSVLDSGTSLKGLSKLRKPLC